MEARDFAKYDMEGKSGEWGRRNVDSCKNNPQIYMCVLSSEK
jgi:hypothetical protein